MIFLPPTLTPLSLIATVVAPPFNVNVSPVIDVMPVNSGFMFTLYLLSSVPSPSTVVFVPASSLDGAAPPPPPAAFLSSSFKESLNFNLYLRVTPFSSPFSAFSLSPLSTTISSLSSTRVSLAFTIKLLNVASFPLKSSALKVFVVTLTLLPACT